MKKILTIAAIVSTFISCATYAAEDVFYLKANAGWSKFNKIKKLKSESDIFFGAGIGYYVMDNVRADLTYDHSLSPTHKGHLIGVTGQKINGSKIRSKIDTILLNGYVDLFDISLAKVFAGAGVGWSAVSAKVSLPNGSDKSGKKNNLAYALHLGVSSEFALGVSGELTYSFRDMGKLKKSTNGLLSSAHLRGQFIAAGIRFDI